MPVFGGAFFCFWGLRLFGEGVFPRGETRGYGVVFRILRGPRLFIGRWEHYDRYRLASLDADTIGGATRQVEHRLFGAAVVDFHNHGEACVFIGDKQQGSEFELAVGGGEEVVVENLAVGGFAALELVVVYSAFQRIPRHGVGGRELLCRHCHAREEQQEKGECSYHTTASW